MHLAIVIPSYGEWKSGFGFDALQSVTRFVTNPVMPDGKAPTVSLHSVKSTYVADARQMLLQEVRAVKADWMLTFDTDMRHPNDTISRLFAHGVVFVGVNYLTRKPPYRFTAMKDGQEVITGEHSTGLEEVDSMGFGVTLMRVDLFDEPGPWFWTPWIQHGDEFSLGTEDVELCARLREKGHKLYIDQDLSKEVGHIGDFEFNYKAITGKRHG